MSALGFIIVLLIVIIAVLAYRKFVMPTHLRIKNIMDKKMFLVDKSGTGSGASYYIKVDFTGPTSVEYNQYGINKEFEARSQFEWGAVGETLRIGQMKISLISGGLLPPTLKLTNDADATNSWTAPLREVSDAPSKKL